MSDNIERILISHDQIQKRVTEIAKDITKDYKGKDLLLVGILRGAVVFLADLIRQIDIHICIDFMAVSSYGASTKSSGVVRILKDLDEEIKDRHVLLVEDIVDTGLTLRYLQKNLQTRNPASISICALLNKKCKQKVPISLKYCGFEIPDEFVVGYGLDFDEKYRNLNDICILNEESIQVS